MIRKRGCFVKRSRYKARTAEHPMQNEFPPPDSLAPMVQRLFVQRVQVDPPSPSIPAWTSSYVILMLAERFDMELEDGTLLPGHRLTAYGPITIPNRFRLDTSQQLELIAAHLRPGIYRRVFPDGSTLVNGSRQIGDDAFGERLADQIRAASAVEDRLAIFNAFIAEFLADAAPPNRREQLFDRALALIDEGPRDLRVADIADQLDVSTVTLRAAFKLATGLSPKRFLRMRRMEQVLHDLHHHPDLSYVSRIFGFYDQAHFIREFRALCRTTPSEFLANMRVQQIHTLFQYLEQ